MSRTGLTSAHQIIKYSQEFVVREEYVPKLNEQEREKNMWKNKNKNTISIRQGRKKTTVSTPHDYV